MLVPFVALLPLEAQAAGKVYRVGYLNTERVLKALLGALGFEHVKVVFEEPPKT